MERRSDPSIRRLAQVSRGTTEVGRCQGREILTRHRCFTWNGSCPRAGRAVAARLTGSASPLALSLSTRYEHLPGPASWRAKPAWLTFCPSFCHLTVAVMCRGDLWWCWACLVAFLLHVRARRLPVPDPRPPGPPALSPRPRSAGQHNQPHPSRDPASSRTVPALGSMAAVALHLELPRRPVPLHLSGSARDQRPSPGEGLRDLDHHCLPRRPDGSGPPARLPVSARRGR